MAVLKVEPDIIISDVAVFVSNKRYNVTSRLHINSSIIASQLILTTSLSEMKAELSNLPIN